MKFASNFFLFILIFTLFFNFYILYCPLCTFRDFQYYFINLRVLPQWVENYVRLLMDFVAHILHLHLYLICSQIFMKYPTIESDTIARSNCKCQANCKRNNFINNRERTHLFQRVNIFVFQCSFECEGLICLYAHHHFKHNRPLIKARRNHIQDICKCSVAYSLSTFLCCVEYFLNGVKYFYRQTLKFS